VLDKVTRNELRVWVLRSAATRDRSRSGAEGRRRAEGQGKAGSAGVWSPYRWVWFSDGFSYGERKRTTPGQKRQKKPPALSRHRLPRLVERLTLGVWKTFIVASGQIKSRSEPKCL